MKTKKNNISKRQRFQCFQDALGSFLTEAKKYNDAHQNPNWIDKVKQ